MYVLMIPLILYSHQFVDGMIHRVQYPIIENDTNVFLEKWLKLEDNLKSGLENVIKQVMPMVIRASSEIELSPDCTDHMLKTMLSLKNGKSWAISMIDATGKPPSGMMVGTMATLGSYDQCLAIKVNENNELLFRGQYCSVEFRPPLPPKPWFYRSDTRIPPFDNFTKDDTTFSRLKDVVQIYYTIAVRYGVCMPSTCTREDMQAMAQMGGDYLGVYATVPRCEVLKDLSLDTVQLTIICVLVVFACLVLIATLYQLVTVYRNSNKLVVNKHTKGICDQLASCFSMLKNAQKLVAVSTPTTEDESIPAMHGIRVLSMYWIILCHTYLYPDWQLARHFQNWQDIIESSIMFQTITNGSGVLDTFIYLGGLLLSFGVIKAVDKGGSTYFNIPLILIRRIWRLLPSTMMVVGLLVLSPLIGSGPLWYEMVQVPADNCRRNWWQIIAFVNNYVPLEHMCLPNTWYISVDMQLFVMGLIYLILVFRKTRLAIIFNLLMAIASIIACGVATYVYKFPPVNLSSNPDQNQRLEFSEATYFQTYPHVAPYAMGLIMGLILARHRDVRIPTWIATLGWLFSSAFCLCVLYGSRVWTFKTPTVLESVVYSSLYRTGFTAGIAWISFACATGRAGYINRFLSWKAFVPLSRLTFLMYLLQVPVIQSYYGASRNGFESNNVTMVWFFFGHLTATILISVVCKILFEAPLMELEKMVLNLILKPNKNQDVGVDLQLNPTMNIKVTDHNTKL